MTTSALARDLAALVGTGNVLSPAPREYLTEASGHPSGPADAVVLPGSHDNPYTQPEHLGALVIETSAKLG